MTLCKNCKYWMDDGEDNSLIHPLDPDTYENMIMPFEVRKCDHPGITLFERNPDPKGVSLCDGSKYFAAMYTGQDYGCVNGEAQS